MYHTPGRVFSIFTHLTAAIVALVAALAFAPLAHSEGEPVTQLAYFRINPDKLAQAQAFLTELTAAVEGKEPGVLAYIAHTSATDPTLLVFFEIYENEAAVKNHGIQPHLAKMRDAFANDVFRAYSADMPVKVERLDAVSGFNR